MDRRRGEVLKLNDKLLKERGQLGASKRVIGVRINPGCRRYHMAGQFPDQSFGRKHRERQCRRGIAARYESVLDIIPGLGQWRLAVKAAVGPIEGNVFRPALISYSLSEHRPRLTVRGNKKRRRRRRGDCSRVSARNVSNRSRAL